MNSRNLDLSFWEEGNNEPDLVFNALLTAVDALMKSGVEAILSAPPGAPEEGQAWIVGESPTGAWIGHADDVAVAVTGGPGWLFFTPGEGWAFWVLDPGATYRYLAGTWAPTGGGALTNPMTSLGDMIYGDVDGEPLRVAAGTEGQVPKVQSDGSIAFEDEAGSSLGSAVTALSISSGVVNIDCALGDYFTLALTANVTSMTISNAPASGTGRTINIRFKQDATGSRTVALPSSFKAITGSDTAVQSAANAYTELFATTVDAGTRWAYSMKGEAP